MAGDIPVIVTKQIFPIMLLFLQNMAPGPCCAAGRLSLYVGILVGPQTELTVPGLFTTHSLMILKYFEVEYFPFYRKSPTEIHKKSFNPSRGLGHNYLQFVKTNNCLQ